MVRRLVKLVLFAVIVHAGIKIVPVFWDFVRFKDGVLETARFGTRRSEAEIRRRVIDLAQTYGIPVTPDRVKVAKLNERTRIGFTYSEDLEYFPRRFYPWEFRVDVEGVPPRYEAIPGLP